ncbi:MAG: glycosyltransferase [Candidatus Pelethousia sp.]|nr:glycosyltransferase [Candidatus Pelethousia sp.]
MIIAIVSVCTFLSTFFAILHFICSFCYRKGPERTPRKTLGFSLIIPCFNEAPILRNTLNGVLRLDYEEYEVIFINDGSTDNTMPVFFELLGLEPLVCGQTKLCAGLRGVYRSIKYPSIFVIDKSNSGKAASLNAGIVLSSRELIVTLDGDSVLEKNALYLMNCAFQDDDVIASGGAVHVMQFFLMDKCKSPLIALQALDYIKGFYIYKPSLCVNNALNIISGAFGVFRKTALIDVGGFRNGLGEDIDITIRLQEYAQKHQKIVTYTMDAICYTECPQTWRDLSRQRVRWQKAFWDAVVHNRSFLLKYFFQSTICFFMIADAAFSGTMAVMTFITNYLLLFVRVFYSLPLLFLIFLGLAVLFNITNSLVAISRAIKCGPYSFRADSATDGCKKTKTGPLYLGVCIDLIIFSFLRIGFFIKGTASYLMKKTGWDKLNRTNNTYTLEFQPYKESS